MTVWRDLRYGVRLLRRAPGFTFLASLVLALGIGATTTIFSLLDAALFRPLPFRDPAALVMLWEAPPGYAYNRVAPLNFVDWSEQNHTFAGMAAVSGAFKTLLRKDASPERLTGQAVTASFFDVLGVPPLAGRTFVPADAQEGARVVVLSERFWRSHFGANPGVIGRTVSLDGDPFTIAGVMPARFQILYDSDIWVVFRPERGPEQRGMHYLQVIGRIRPGVSAAQAGADMDRIASNIARIAPATNKGWGVTIQPLREALVGHDLRTTSLIFGGIVGLMLLLAAANVANLLLARGVGRAREIAVRAALGGNRGRLLQQLLVESLLLAGMGGVLGLLLSAAVVQAAPVLLPSDLLPAGITLALDGRVMLFATGVTIGTGLLFGLAPAWSITDVSLSRALSSGSRGSTRRSRALRTTLAMAEVAIAIVLLTGAGLLVRTLLSLDGVDSGAEAHDVLTMTVMLPNARYTSQERALAFYQAATRELAALPGMRAVAFGGSLPLDGWDIGQGFTVIGDPPVDEARRPAAHYQITGTGFFDALGIPILSGRSFSGSDTGHSLPVCIVSEGFVRRYARGRDPLTLQVRVQAMSPEGPTPVTRQVVGVARQIRETPGEDEQAAQIYVPLAQNPWYFSSLSVRTAGPPLALLPAVKAAIGRVDPSLAVAQVRTIDEIAAQATAGPRFRARLMSAFAALALLVAAVGIAGVLAFSIEQRTRELGVRMALGARTVDILRLVLSDGLRITVVGALVGLAGAAALSRLVSSLLYGVTALDPVTFVAAPAALLAAAATACALPALRAARIDAAVAMRDE